MCANRVPVATIDRLGSAARILLGLALGIVLICPAPPIAAAEESPIGLSIESLLDGHVEDNDKDEDGVRDDCASCGPDAAKFDTWEPIAGVEEHRFGGDAPAWESRNWFYDLGFRHSSMHGRNVGRGKPLKNSSWSNRPYHVDWFVGQLLSDDLINNRIGQENAIFSGVRIGWDFDHYWGMEWRFGWADPDVEFNTPLAEPNNGSFFLSDLDLVYYPWGDSKIRPYCLLGTGFTRLKFRDENSVNQDSTLFTIPYGAGIRFSQWPWLNWRLELLNNLAFGSDSLSTMSNISLTVGMEWRLGAKPSSYWPWRSSRYIW